MPPNTCIQTNLGPSAPDAPFCLLNPSVLQEYCADCEEEGRLKTVARSAELRDNAILPPTLQSRAGDLIYAGLREGFRVCPELCPKSVILLGGMPGSMSCSPGVDQVR